MGDYFFMPCCKENKEWRKIKQSTPRDPLFVILGIAAVLDVVC